MTPNPTTSRAYAVAAGIACLLGLSACGGSPEPTGPGTVTVTPTVTASGAQGGGSAPATTSSAPTQPRTDVKGRAYDLGVITTVGTSAGQPAIKLDRWTVRNLDDADLAANGYPVKLIGRSPFFNQNSDLTFLIPLRSDASVIYRHCAAADLPAETRSASPTELKDLAAPENVVLATLDEDGFATALQNYPVCG